MPDDDPIAPRARAEPPLGNGGAGAADALVPLSLAAVLAVVFVATAIAPPAGRLNWLLEVGPALIGIAVLAITWKRFPMSRAVYVAVFLHSLVLVYGGYHTYAATPLGNWALDAFHLSRNHYDRVGHLALGFFPAFAVREVLLRATSLRRGGWLTFLVLSVLLAVGAFWELLEWWSTYIVAADVGQAFLGSQGDPWDAQWDMFLALVGGAVSLGCFSALHDREIDRLTPPGPSGSSPRDCR